MRFTVLFALLLSFLGNSQSIIQYDYMETSSPTYLSAGWWTPAATANWFTNASVTPTLSAVLYGLGAGTSANELDWYTLPNVTGLNNTHQYQLKFKLASYTFSNSTAATRGLDAADIVEVQVSTNGGTSYSSELRITGNANARWPFTSTGSITHTANGTFTNSAAPTGDVYQAPAGITTTGPSSITLNLPAGISQVAIDIFCRVNSAGEEWWIDNIELWDLTPVSLPVELTEFSGASNSCGNLIKWQTASEHNSDYYLLKRSTTGDFDQAQVVTKTQATGASTEIFNYAFCDTEFRNEINYYLLVQFDFDGKSKEYGPIQVDNRSSDHTVIKTINLLGQEVGLDATGILFNVQADGKIVQIYR
jgi:hypothetical protein